MPRFEYKNYLLFLLTIVAVFNYLDRGIIALAMESIKEDFQLSDSQLGLMSGFAFALFYAIAGIPIARWADRGNRNHVVTLTTGLWSLMVVISGFVGNFTQLLLVRVGVAVGESGCVPSAQSLLADYFDRAERPRAMAIYWMSSPLSTILAFLAGGWLIDKFGWQVTFILIGLPGIVLAVLVKFSVREPRLAQQVKIDISSEGLAAAKAEPAQVPLRIVVHTLWQNHAFRHVMMAYCVFMFFIAGISVWIPAFFIRTYSMAAGELGTWIGLTWGFGGLFFTYLGGVLATRYAAHQEGLQMQGVAIICLLCSLFYVLCFLSKDQYLGLFFISVAVGVLLPMTNAAFYASLQSLVEERMRAVALALIFMFSNLIGLGLGPVAVGMASDLLAPDFGQASLRYALLLFSPGYLWCAFHCWKAAQTIEEEIRLVESNITAGNIDTFDGSEISTSCSIEPLER